jgi:hypothetical protein
MTKARWPVRGILALAFLALAAPCQASPSEDAFAAFLQKKYAKTGGLFGALDKILPPANTVASPVPLEGRKADGSYWWGAYFGPGNISVFGWAHRALSERCTKDGGALTQAAPYSILGGAPTSSVTLDDPGGAGGFTLTPRMMEDWAATDMTGQSTGVMRRPQSTSSRNAALVDARAVLGVFTCGMGTRSLWHVSIIPTPLGQWDFFVSNEATGTHWVMLRIQAVTRALIDRTAMVYAAQAEDQMRARRTEQALAAKRHDDWTARERIERPRIAAFQKAIKIGDDTNCGLVLGLNGPLAEVQVPTTITLASGAARVFVKRVALAPPDSRFDCYVMGMMTANPIDTRPVE